LQHVEQTNFNVVVETASQRHPFVITLTTAEITAMKETARIQHVSFAFL